MSSQKTGFQYFPVAQGVNARTDQPVPQSQQIHHLAAQNMLNSQLAIRQEIQRFESVHPSIYAIYDLIDLIPDPQLSQSIRDHVVCIEGEKFKFALLNSRKK
uniref:CSON013361 protein n=1 Tax=Culicoides sonorensis TaxID=179676 RepID=A0A336M832_CULSO